MAPHYGPPTVPRQFHCIEKPFSQPRSAFSFSQQTLSIPEGTYSTAGSIFDFEKPMMRRSSTCDHADHGPHWGHTGTTLQVFEPKMLRAQGPIVEIETELMKWYEPMISDVFHLSIFRHILWDNHWITWDDLLNCWNARLFGLMFRQMWALQKTIPTALCITAMWHPYWTVFTIYLLFYQVFVCISICWFVIIELYCWCYTTAYRLPEEAQGAVGMGPKPIQIATAVSGTRIWS